MVSPELLRRYPFFATLDDAQLKAIAMLSDEVSYPKDAVIFETDRPADALYFLLDGGVDLHYLVECSYKPEGWKDFFISEINPGEPFGISSLIEPYRFTGMVKVSLDSHALKIDAAGLRALCEVDSKIAANLMRQIAKAAMSRLSDTRIQLVAARA